MKNTDPVPRQEEHLLADNAQNAPEQSAPEHTQQTHDKKKDSKKKAKRNLWPLKAMLITLLISAAVNALSNFALEGAKLWIALVVTVVIVIIGVIFDIVGTAATSCDVQPLLAMASRKVRGAKTAVKLAKKADVVSSVCNDIVGDICGIVSGVCAAAIATQALQNLTGQANFWLTVVVYAVVSTLTITLKAVGKSIAVKNSTKIVFTVAKILSIFRKEG